MKQCLFSIYLGLPHTLSGTTYIYSTWLISSHFLGDMDLHHYVLGIPQWDQLSRKHVASCPTQLVLGKLWCGVQTESSLASITTRPLPSAKADIQSPYLLIPVGDAIPTHYASCTCEWYPPVGTSLQFSKAHPCLSRHNNPFHSWNLSSNC